MIRLNWVTDLKRRHTYKNVANFMRPNAVLRHKRIPLVNTKAANVCNVIARFLKYFTMQRPHWCFAWINAATGKL
jgi:hypothetical protein